VEELTPAQLVTTYAPGSGPTSDLRQSSRQEEGQPIDPQRFRCGAQGAVTPQQAAISRSRATKSDEDKVVLQQVVDGLSYE
jgi:hypothetical protein